MKFREILALGTVGTIMACGGDTEPKPELASIAVSCSATTVAAGQTAQCTAQGKDKLGANFEVSSFTWTTSDATIATVSTTGLVTGVKGGTVSVRAAATSATGTAIQGSSNLSISAAPDLTTITVACTPTTFPAGQTSQCTAAGKDQTGAAFSVSSFTWSSSDATVATVSSSGLVTGLKAGAVTISASATNGAGSTITGASASIPVTAPPFIEHTGAISANETWAAGTTHRVIGDVTVSGAGSPALTIAAGAIVEFASGTSLVIGNGSAQGQLLVMGTAASPVTMRSTAAAPSRGAWGTVAIREGGPRSEIHYTTISFCGGPSGLTDACLRVLGASGAAHPLIDHVTVEQSASYGVLATGGGGFAATSTTLTVNNSASNPIKINASVAGTLPAGGSYAANTPNTIRLAGENVTTSQTWASLGIPYFLDNDVNVAGAATPVLTIAAGTTVRFGSLVGIHVGDGSSPGALMAEGTVALPIVLTADAATPTAGFWSGIILGASAQNTSRLANVTLDYCGGFSGSGNGCLVIGGFGGGTGPRPDIDTVTIDHSSSYGVYAPTGGGFGPTSRNLTIRNGGSYAMQILPNLAFTIPTIGAITGNTPNAIELPDGDVSQTQTWSNPGVPYVVGIVHVAGSTTPELTLTAGSTFRFNSSKYLEIGNGSSPGVLKAPGTAAAPITFTVNTTTQAPGQWAGITFGASAQNTSLLNYAIVEYGGFNNFSGFPLANVVVVGDKGGFITNSTIRNSSNCGISRVNASGSPPITTDFTAAALNNTFSNNAGGNQCTRP